MLLSVQAERMGSRGTHRAFARWLWSSSKRGISPWKQEGEEQRREILWYNDVHVYIHSKSNGTTCGIFRTIMPSEFPTWHSFVSRIGNYSTVRFGARWCRELVVSVKCERHLATLKSFEVTSVNFHGIKIHCYQTQRCGLLTPTLRNLHSLWCSRNPSWILS